MEKQRAVNGLLKKVIVNDREIKTPLELNRKIYELFKKSVFKTTDEILQFLEVIELPKISNDQFLICEKEISENDLFLSLKGMENNKSPGNDGLTKEFYDTFWTEIKGPLLDSIHHAQVTKQLSISQKQAIIKLIEKKTKTKDMLKIGVQFHY